MKPSRRLDLTHDPANPSPWLALYLDESVPMPDAVKEAWLVDASSRSRQYLLPFVRPLARFAIKAIQVLKIVWPKRWHSSAVLHRLIAWGLANFVRPEANWLIMRHFHLGAEIQAFLRGNVPGLTMPPLYDMRFRTLASLRDHAFLRHDLNLFNFVIGFSQGVRARGRELGPPERLDFSMITEGELPIDPLPERASNFIDVQTAIELYTPIYQLLLSDDDFWRATNSLQLDETIAAYASRILGSPIPLLFVTNRHPLVALPTLQAGHRLVLHGLATELMHGLLVACKKRQAAGIDPVIPGFSGIPVR